MDVSLYTWLVVVGIVLALLALDLLTFSRKPHEVGFKEATWWSIFYIAVAILFGIWVWWDAGSVYGTEYFAAYLVEKSLSVDNVFVFAIILTTFAVPSIYQQRVLLIGIIRAIFIAVGAAALAYFAFTFVIFGAILIWSGIGLMRHWNEDPDPSDNMVGKRVKRRMPYTDTYHGTKLFIKENGVRVATPMFIVMIAIASTDLLFALDSIPATFGVTQEPLLVFSANAFALLGLRALYFLLKGLLDKLIYLSLGLSFILIFIGIKLMLLFGYETFGSVVPKIETNVSLIVIAVILAVSIVASLIKSAKDPEAKAHAGRVTAPKKEEEKAS